MRGEESMGAEGRYWNARTETMSRSEQEAHQWRLLHAQLCYAYTHSPFYRERWQARGVDPRAFQGPEDYFTQIPFLSKTDLIADQQDHPPFGTLLAVDPKALVRLYISPGPLTWGFTATGYRKFAEVWAKGAYVCGVRAGDIVDVTAAYGWVPAGSLFDEAYRLIGAAVIPGNVGMSDFHVEVMKRVKVTVVQAFTTFLATLGEVVKQKGIDPRRDLALRLGIIGGEIRSEAQKASLGDPFGGIAIREQYGTAEIGIIASECEEGGGMHLNEDFLVEIIDPETGEHVPPGASGEIVTSDVVREAMPIIRYRTGDLTAGLNLEPCPCGRTTPRLQRILGRSSDIPRIKGMFIIPRTIQTVLARYPELGRFQIVVDRPRHQDELTIRIEYTAPVDVANLTPKLVEELRNAIRVTPQVELLPAGTIPAEAGLVDDRRKV
ncbi:MAG: phenylacetate--CoA ligase family protein [Nitrospinota bacterium]|nr:MAG: phenylacetate--CoA ligase family protein [Nitrospinota bacterium]